MRTVHLISNWQEEKCGNAQYGRNLCRELEKEFEVLTNTEWPTCYIGDVIIINWCESVVEVNADKIRQAQNYGVKVILIVQNTRGNVLEIGDLPADITITHDPMTGASLCIPHGIPEVDHLSNSVFDDLIGTAGFAFPYKNMDTVVKAAAYMNAQALMITPVHRLCNPELMFANWNRLLPGVVICTDWLSEEEVVRRLSACAVNMYCSNDDTGQSGSARLILAAKRPTIIMRSKKVSSLFPYEDEIYFVNNNDEAYSTAQEICNRVRYCTFVKTPNCVIQEQGWSQTGKMYRNSVSSLIGQMTCS